MAIYHLEAKVVSRGTGRSAVAASAYLSCSKILNDYDGVQHDYTRKKGLVWQEVFLPEFAPSEWKERGVLWNAVEENEKTKDSRLAREFVVALPIELSEAQWEKLLSDFISDKAGRKICCRVGGCLKAVLRIKGAGKKCGFGRTLRTTGCPAIR